MAVTITRRGLVAALLATAIPPACAESAAVTMTPAEAHAKAQAGHLTLVDIRTPAEWRETGLPASAHAITMNQEVPALLAALDQALGGDRTKPLALICRTGNRSSVLVAELRKAGFTTMIDIAEGVVGGRNGPGWLKAGLPTRPGVPQSKPIIGKQP